MVGTVVVKTSMRQVFGYPLPWGVLVDYSRTTFGSADTKQLEKGVYSLLQKKSRPV